MASRSLTGGPTSSRAAGARGSSPRSRGAIYRSLRLARMAPTTAAQIRRGRRPLLRSALLGGLLVAAVIAGLLAMHTFNLHGALPTREAVAAPLGHSGEIHQVTDSHGAAVAQAPTGGQTHDPDASCASCGSGAHWGMAMTCVLALLLVIFDLLPPRRLPAWLHHPPRPLPRPPFTDRLLSRAPSLQVLCIIRI